MSDDQYRRAKLQHYHDTHERRITWGDKYIAPPEAYGMWIEIKMIPDEKETGIWHETWLFPSGTTKKTAHDVMLGLKGILEILCGIKYGHCTPYIIQIDNMGYCHLISACVRGKQTVMDMVLQTGTEEWVKTG